MKQPEKSWFSWRLAGLMVVVVFIPLAEPVKSQSNSTLMRLYCSRYQGMSPKYFLSNLNTTLSSLRRQLLVNGVRYAIARTLFNGESVWGLASCRDYVSNANCVACFDYAVAQLKGCGLGNGATTFYNDCDVSYENYNFFNEEHYEDFIVICDNTTSPQPTEFREAAKSLLLDLQIAAPRTSNYYAVSTRKVAIGNETVYAIAQCNLNISRNDCVKFLKYGSRSLYYCLPKTTYGRVKRKGCFMRYDRTQFFRQNQTTDIASLLWDGDSSKKKSIIGVIGGVSFMLLLLAFFLWYSRWKKIGSGQQDAPELEGAVEYNYKHLQLATHNFSEENILGKGGFGEVFKATLGNKKVVAVKKLKVGYAGAKVGFENEILLISQIHHRNLLGLLGWSTEESSLLLVLEYMPNGSLDSFLWGPKRGTLNWKRRYDIILGIARGLAHLHKEIHIKIVHRDIKSSNVLLDDDFQPKIADFGLARFQPEDQTHVITKFAGTLGYTAPEYALYGRLSDKVDTYSFGIVILEIISGRRCTDVNLDGPSTDYLLEHAWKLYERKEHMKLVDETMDVNQYKEEHVTKIIETALLCTQSPVSERPTMSDVVLMLSTDTTLGERQLTRPNLTDQNRRIHIGSS